MIRLINVKKRYKTIAGDVNALDDVSLQFPSTGMVFVTGKSGSGKTTMLNVVGGLDGLDSGEIEILGKKFSSFTQSEYDSYRNTFVGFIFQEYNLLPDFTVEKNIQIANELQGVKVEQRVIDDLLEKVGLKGLGKRKPSELSGGQKQRVAIARALVKNPKIIMADEPTGALDSQTGVQVMETLKKLSKDKLVLVVSHDLELAEKYADRIIRIVDGKVVEDVSIDETEIAGNLYVEEDKITVKSGATLEAHEVEILLKSIREKKKILSAEKLVDKSAKQTKKGVGDAKVVSPKLIKSKMKFSSAAFLGVKSLTVKPLRLAFTIFLSVVAFSVFGLFDTIASYNATKVMNNLLNTADYGSISLTQSYNRDEEGENYDYINQTVRFTQSDIDALNRQTGYKFRGVYPINDGRLSNVNDTSEVKLNGTSYGKYYYLKEFSGIVEFKDAELNKTPIVNTNNETEYRVTGINADGFKLDVLYGDFPKLVQKNGVIEQGSLKNIAITSYMANSIKYWLNSSGQQINGQAVEDISQLVNYTVTIGSTQYVISCILKVDDVPQKYDKLKTISINNKEKALSDDLRTYLFSNLHCCLIVPEGYIECRKESKNLVTKYYSPTYASSNDAPIIKLPNSADVEKPVQDLKLIFGNENVTVYYNQDDFEFYPMSDVENRNKSQVVFFNNYDSDTANDVTQLSLAEDEALIHVSDYYTLFQREYFYAQKTKDGTSSSGLGLKNEMDNASLGSYFEINYMMSKVGDKSNFDTKLKDLLKIILRSQELQTFLNSYWDDAFDTDSWSNQKGLVKNVQINYKNGDTKQLKIVGIYMGNETKSSGLNPLVLSTAGMERLGIYSNQGDYCRIISPLKTNALNGSNTLANYMTTTDGELYSWYQSSVLSMIEENDEMIQQFADLFLYAALVLALFSIFMLFQYISASIVSKRQTIGVLRALGSGGRDVFRMFITESLIIALINGILASVVAYLGCILVNYYVRDIMNLVINFAIYGIRQILVIFGLSIGAGVLSSIIPIIKIAREKPVKLIREP